MLMPYIARLMAITLAVALTSSVTLAQPAPDNARIGILYPTVADRPFVDILVAELARIGRVEEQNLVIDYRWGAGLDNATRDQTVTELVGLGVDVIVTRTPDLVDMALQHGGAIPIVFCQHSDPVGFGHAASLARPGGRATGLSVLNSELRAKRFQLLKDLMPNAQRLGLLFRRGSVNSHAGMRRGIRKVEKAGAELGFGLHVTEVPELTASSYDKALSAMSGEGVAGFWLTAEGYQDPNLGFQVAELALKYRLASIASRRAWPEMGGLMSYGADRESMHERCAWYVDQILRGADPAELPIEQAARFDLVVNKNTMEALGLTLPPKILFAATEVIE